MHLPLTFNHLISLVRNKRQVVAAKGGQQTAEHRSCYSGVGGGGGDCRGSLVQQENPAVQQVLPSASNIHNMQQLKMCVPIPRVLCFYQN